MIPNELYKSWSRIYFGVREGLQWIVDHKNVSYVLQVDGNLSYLAQRTEQKKLVKRWTRFALDEQAFIDNVRRLLSCAWMVKDCRASRFVTWHSVETKKKAKRPNVLLWNSRKHLYVAFETWKRKIRNKRVRTMLPNIVKAALVVMTTDALLLKTKVSIYCIEAPLLPTETVQIFVKNDYKHDPFQSNGFYSL